VGAHLGEDCRARPGRSGPNRVTGRAQRVPYGLDLPCCQGHPGSVHDTPWCVHPWCGVSSTPLAGLTSAGAADPKVPLAATKWGAFALDMSLHRPAPARPTYRWPDQKPGRHASGCRASSQSCRAVTSTRADACPRSSHQRRTACPCWQEQSAPSSASTPTATTTPSRSSIPPEQHSPPPSYPPMRSGIAGCSPSPATTRPDAASGPSKAPAASATGLTTYLLEQQEWVVEIDRPARPARRNGSKTDELDAVR